MDAERTLTLVNEHAVPIIGLVKNMSSMTCPHCDQRIDMFAGSARLTDAGLRILGEIPFDLRFSSTSPGHPLVLADPRGPIALQFAKIAHATRRWLASYEAEKVACKRKSRRLPNTGGK
jgi:ATP-binding protein involved in chromosome partitioning